MICATVSIQAMYTHTHTYIHDVCHSVDTSYVYMLEYMHTYKSCIHTNHRCICMRVHTYIHTYTRSERWEKEIRTAAILSIQSWWRRSISHPKTLEALRNFRYEFWLFFCTSLVMRRSFSLESWVVNVSIIVRFCVHGLSLKRMYVVGFCSFAVQIFVKQSGLPHNHNIHTL